MSRSDDARYALEVIAGRVDLANPGVAARLAVMKAQHLGDATMRGLIDRAAGMHIAMLDCTLRTADKAYLRAVAGDGVNFLDDRVWERLEPIHERYKADSEMMQLFAQAADAFAAAAEDAAAAVLTGPAAALAIKKASRPRRDS
ncbi:hypothetical protein [Variovorax paradoxus]|uniref:hypothetical protein n=1 Tax=Variovorax paradoxus TaxID=34073 RepID=UPI00277F4E09|nr:hypothetical protein [Variovorax paradoxus]MDQ0590988.1 hypothetical protein [Variovorax paradoxus]